MSAPDTKTRIFEVAIDLYATDGYTRVSMRQIADGVGIRPSSIYNHYSSKEDLLTAIFDWYEGNLQCHKPDINALLEMVGQAHPHDILKETIIIYPDDILPNMARAMLIANALSGTNARADNILNNMITLAEKLDRPLLERMLALDVIEPINIESFMHLHSNYSYAAAVRFYGRHEINTPDYICALDMLFGLVKPKGIPPVQSITA